MAVRGPGFASDNYAPMCPEALEALVRANEGPAPAYGADAWTARAEAAIAAWFEAECRVFFVGTGTAGNALALATLARPYERVLCHEAAHAIHDECGAPGLVGGGVRLTPLPGAHGRIDRETLAGALAGRADVHHGRAAALTLTQPTELGTVYTPEALAGLCALAHGHGLRVHVDGARLFNAVAALGCAPRALGPDAGVDVLTLGGTKGGLGLGEALVFFDLELAEGFAWRHKQAGQLFSKMRFLSAPWTGLLEGDAWRRHAAHANACARRLAEAVAGVEGVRLAHPVEANAVFLELPAAVAAGLEARGWRFHALPAWGGARFLCAWDTEEAAVDLLAADIAELAAG
ncbi:threonine aldolase family protein [Inmirania thermothiophila]|uniref:L-threonine aldolase n=1 Tax=Inmirania thermothiophila TaxID=1750597 RepID=A0A3N1Y202_9GAMM|nr:beta-eliminating lyase-related protein [Inmirania thermothiophila]ROR32846.1 L-threonine aldolase [Inmirania thermothiophila]